MAKNGDGEFGFFICQIRHFSPIFDFGISHLTDFQTANHLETLQITTGINTEQTRPTLNESELVRRHVSDHVSQHVPRHVLSS